MRFSCGSVRFSCGSVEFGVGRISEFGRILLGFLGAVQLRFRCGSVAVQCGSVRFVRFVRLGAVHAVGLRLGAVVVLVSPQSNCMFLFFENEKKREKKKDDWSGTPKPVVAVKTHKTCPQNNMIL